MTRVPRGAGQDQSHRIQTGRGFPQVLRHLRQFVFDGFDLVQADGRITLAELFRPRMFPAHAPRDLARAVDRARTAGVGM
jgi:hypothetical protein